MIDLLRVKGGPVRLVISLRSCHRREPRKEIQCCQILKMGDLYLTSMPVWSASRMGCLSLWQGEVAEVQEDRLVAEVWRQGE